jgi:hypothetical protein
MAPFAVCYRRGMSRRAIWETVFDRFDPERPPDFPAWHAARPLSPLESITEALDFDKGTPHVLLTGTVGTGKSTELLRVAEARASKEFVVLLDLARHFDQVVGDPSALEHVTAWEVVFLAGLAVLRSAEERLGFALPVGHRRAIEQAWVAAAKLSKAIESTPEIDAGKLAKSLVLLASAAGSAVAGPAGAAAGAAVGGLAALTESAKWSLPFGLSKTKLPDQDIRAETLLQCVNVIIGLVQQRGSKVLVILDGLDKVKDFDRAKELFLESTMIAQLACRVVLCGPFVLRTAGTLACMRGFSDVPPLVNVPVMAQDNPSRPGPGIPFFRDLFGRRVADLGEPPLLLPKELDRLAYYSGGRARDFVGMVQRVARKAWSRDVETAIAEIVEAVIDERRRQWETGLNRGHIRVLEAIANDPEHRLPDEDLAQKLLAAGLLLPYPDGNEWYYPHPLLTMSLLRVKLAGSSN